MLLEGTFNQIFCHTLNKVKNSTYAFFQIQLVLSHGAQINSKRPTHKILSKNKAAMVVETVVGQKSGPKAGV